MQRLKIQLRVSEGVNKSDYYTDFFVDTLIPFLKTRKGQPHSVLELGTGRGYISILLAKLFPSIKTIIATDVDTTAVQLAKQNVYSNHADTHIRVVQGDLFAPVENQKFDLIVSVPPQLPLTRQHIRKLIPQVDRYHLTTSVGGKTGRAIVDTMIRLAPEYLTPRGILAFVHSDLIGFPKTMKQLEAAGFRATLLGTRRKLLKETTLTRLSRSAIEDTGYRFQKDKMGRDFLKLGVFLGIYDPASRQKHFAYRSSNNNEEGKRCRLMGFERKRLH